MIYVFQFYVYDDDGGKQFVEEYRFNTLPYIPNKQNHIIIDNKPYTIKKISIKYKKEENEFGYGFVNMTIFKIILQLEWWELNN